MKKLQTPLARAFVALALAAGIASPAWSAQQTVTLSVPTMDCPVCPITVKKALTRVTGVVKAEVDFDKRLAVVIYDDARTQVGQLTKATANAGYPSQVKP